jgi:hypothetical protein
MTMAGSGGTVETPARQKLLADFKERKIDIVVVYKVDRLTRSLTDFAKLVELRRRSSKVSANSLATHISIGGDSVATKLAPETGGYLHGRQ